MNDHPCCPSPDRWILVLCFLFIASVCGRAESADEVATDSQIAALIRQLGAPDFMDRERATQRLLKIGEPALPALQESFQSDDREIRERSRQVLALVQKRVRSRRLQAFVDASPSKDLERDMPGWHRFSKKYGSHHAAKQIYARILESEWELIAQYFSDDAAKKGGLATLRFQQVQGRQGQVRELGTVLAFFFLASEHAEHFQMHHQLYALVRHPDLATMLSPVTRRRTAERRIVRKMVGNWIVAAGGSQLNHRSALQLTLLYRMHDETRVLAERILLSKESLNKNKWLAMESIVIRNDRQQMELIEPFLEDATKLGETGKRVRQLRDVALACMMQLQGHDVQKIGVKTKKNNPYSAFEFATIGYVTEADRAKAFQTYRDLQENK